MPDYTGWTDAEIQSISEMSCGLVQYYGRMIAYYQKQHYDLAVEMKRRTDARRNQENSNA